MDLSDGRGTLFSLSVSGYQFPAMATEPYDSNWLNIAGRVEHPLGGWTFHDACLLTYELEHLCNWLEAVAVDPRSRHEPATFLEPNLEFHIVQGQDRGILRVHLRLECCSPPWLADHDDRVDGVDLEFPIESHDLGAAARNLRSLLSRVPQRAER